MVLLFGEAGDGASSAPMPVEDTSASITISPALSISLQLEFFFL
jgi:hypothetical protein